MGAMQGQGPQEIYDRISELLMDMQKAQWVSIHRKTITMLVMTIINKALFLTIDLVHFLPSGLLDPCTIDQFQLCSRAASAECSTFD